jgi:DNA-binding transcriptional LysR family regulator
MDLRQLRYFIALAETLNFHRAAERLHMSQPPLTVAIRRLEEELGAALFVREPRGVRLTAAGVAALPAARATLAGADAFREAVRHGAAGLTGRLAIGFIGSAIGELLPGVLRPFREAYPQVELALEESVSAAIVSDIRARRLDLGLVRLPLSDTDGIGIAVVERDRLAVAVPASHPLFDRTSIALPELADHDFIMFSPVSVLSVTVRLACQQAGFVPRVAQAAVQVQTILSLVEAGLGVALLPSRVGRFATDRVRIVPLDQEVALEIGLVHPSDAGPLVHNFVATALAACDIDHVSSS